MPESPTASTIRDGRITDSDGDLGSRVVGLKCESDTVSPLLASPPSLHKITLTMGHERVDSNDLLLSHDTSIDIA
jgi:hypothetical protein